MKNIILFILSILLVGCEEPGDHRYSFYIKNNSNYRITAYGAYILPDTLLPATKPEHLKDADPGQFIEIIDYEVNDKKFERLKTEKITVFIFKADIFTKYSWDSIRINYDILKRYEFNKEYINSMGANIPYP